MADLPAPTFRKTKTEKWAVMGPVETLQAALDGDGKVQVLKRSGDYSTFRIASLGKPFDVDGVAMCYGYSPDDTESDGGGSASGGGASPARSAAAPRRSAPRTPPPPPVDGGEPLPEYQGGPEDEWSPDF